MSNTHLNTAPGTSSAVPCNTLIDCVPAGTLENVVQTLALLSCVDLEGLAKQPEMGIFHALQACMDALEYEINRYPRHTTLEGDSHE
jgi:hypothetical protein